MVVARSGNQDSKHYSKSLDDQNDNKNIVILNAPLQLTSQFPPRSGAWRISQRKNEILRCLVECQVLRMATKDG